VKATGHRRDAALSSPGEPSGELRMPSDELASSSGERVDSSGEPEMASGSRVAWLDYLAVAVALVGLADAVYLTSQHYAGSYVRCAIVTGCNEVLGSAYATVNGVPVAAFGSLAYFAVFSLSILSAFGYAFARRLLAPVVALMLAATLWFLYVQAFILGKFCSYCLLSAILTLVLVGLVVAGRLRRSVKIAEK
jgi:uncharacterized membrane protein